MKTTTWISAALAATLLIAAGCTEAQRSAMRNRRNAKNWINPATPEPGDVQIAEDPKILPETFFAAARLFETQGQYDKAIVQYRKAIAVNHEFAEAYNRLGILLGLLGRHSDAEQALVTAVRLKPQMAAYRNNLGFQYALQGRWSDAEAELSNAIRLKPDFNRAYVNLGIALAKQHRFEQSFDAFSAALPEADAYYNLGLMFRADNRYRDAADAFHQVLAINTKFEAARKQLKEIEPKLALQTPLEPRSKTAPESALASRNAAPALPVQDATIVRVDHAQPAPAATTPVDSHIPVVQIEKTSAAPAAEIDEAPAQVPAANIETINAETELTFSETPIEPDADEIIQDDPATTKIATEHTSSPAIDSAWRHDPAIEAISMKETTDQSATAHDDIAIIQASPIAAPPIMIEATVPVKAKTTAAESVSITPATSTAISTISAKDACFEADEIHEFDSFDFSCDNPEFVLASPIGIAVQSIGHPTKPAAGSSQKTAKPIARKTAKSEVIPAADDSVLEIEAQAYETPATDGRAG